jgi:transposase
MMKVKIYPTRRQRQWFIKTQHSIRALRNAAIEQVNKGAIKVSQIRALMVSTEERKNVVASKFPHGASPEELAHHYLKWQAIDTTPATIRKNAMRKLMGEYSANFKAVKEGRRTNFQMRFASRKVKRGRVNIPLEAKTFRNKNTFDSERIYLFERLLLDDGQKFGSLRYKMQGTSKRRKKLPSPRDHDCQVVYEHPDRWYLLVPYEKEEVKVPATFTDISIDPGVREFQNFYSNDAKMVGSIDLPGRKEELAAILHKIVKHQRQVRVGCNASIRKFHKKRFSMLWSKIKNKKRDLHAKTIKFLVDNFEEIRIGDFGSEFVKRNKKMGKGVKQNCSFLAHYEFRQRLLEHSTMRTIIVVPESYTSKTCCRCGLVNGALGSSKTFVCPGCGFVTDRDSNGAVNMHIKDRAKATV